MMNLYLLFIFIWSFVYSSVICDKSCSREGSRIVRDYFTQVINPIYERNDLSIPFKCVLSPKRDIFHEHESNKAKTSNGKWLCKYCNKTFNSEYFLDTHLANRHEDTLIEGENAVCLADYCSIFRCDVLKRLETSSRSTNPFVRNFVLTMKKSKKYINEQQLTILRNRCTSIINQCIPSNINHEIRDKMQHEMYNELCAYLTNIKYFDLPNYQKSFVNCTNTFCIILFFVICLFIIRIMKYSDWRFTDNDDDESEKHLSDETISTATALLSKTPTSGIIHSSKSPSSTVRHRVRFKFLDECQTSCHEHI